MADIQFLTAENRWGKKRGRKKTVTTATKYNCRPITMGSHKNTIQNWNQQWKYW